MFLFLFSSVKKAKKHTPDDILRISLDSKATEIVNMSDFFHDKFAKYFMLKKGLCLKLPLCSMLLCFISFKFQNIQL